jgi:dCTP deaminase
MEPGIKRAGKISYGLSSYGYDVRLGYKFKIFTPTLCAVVDPKKFDERAFVEVDTSPAKHHWTMSYPKNNPEDVSWACANCHKDIGKDLNIIYSDGLIDEFCPNIINQDHILIPPNSFALGETMETFDIPRDCLAIVLGKSTYARCGIIVNVTPLEPEWKGKVTVEISNTTPLPAKVYAGEGIMQVLFFHSAGITDIAIRAIGRMLEPGPTGYNKQLEEFFVSMMDTKRTCRVSYADKKGKYQNQEGLTLPEVDKVDTKKT